MRTSPLAAAAGLLLLLAPALAAAHEHGTFRIGGTEYEITVGMIDEPSVVDESSGVELIVAKTSGEDAVHDEGGDHDGTPVTGLEAGLKVEVTAGGQTKTFDLKPAYGSPGTYQAVFVPTAKTTYAFRFVGTINGTNVDLSFTCNPAGHPVTPENTTETGISAGVTQLSRSGAFGCPAARSDIGFPDALPTTAELAADVRTVREAATGPVAGYFGLVLGALGLIAGIAAYAKAARR